MAVVQVRRSASFAVSGSTPLDVMCSMGGGYSSGSRIPPRLEDAIRGMDGGIVPFGNEEFDFVINNQVMEHVENLDFVLSEIHRVLKPGGNVLSLFPDSGVWREGHCGIPFLHWFRDSRLRLYYAATLRTLGLGHFKRKKSVMQWSRDFCEWLDKWTFYRDTPEIERCYAQYFIEQNHIEDYWLQKRLGSWRFLATSCPVALQRFVVRKWIGLVFTTRKAV